MHKNLNLEADYIRFIHTGIKPGNRKPSTYTDYLVKRGFGIIEQLELLIATKNITHGHRKD